MLFLIDAAVSARRERDAQRVWRQALEATKWPQDKDDSRSLVFNGRFEHKPADGGFDWRELPVAGALHGTNPGWPAVAHPARGCPRLDKGISSTPSSSGPRCASARVPQRRARSTSLLRCPTNPKIPHMTLFCAIRPAASPDCSKRDCPASTNFSAEHGLVRRDVEKRRRESLVGNLLAQTQRSELADVSTKSEYGWAIGQFTRDLKYINNANHN